MFNSEDDDLELLHVSKVDSLNDSGWLKLSTPNTKTTPE
jgi:hypothetical protein